MVGLPVVHFILVKTFSKYCNQNLADHGMHAVTARKSEYHTPLISILWNAVTSPETVLNGSSVARMLYTTPSPYFIVLASSVKTKEGKVIEFHSMDIYGFP